METAVAMKHSDYIRVPPCRGRGWHRGAFRPKFTYSGDTLGSVNRHRNVTLSLPESLLRRFRVYAAARNESMTSLMTSAIRNMIEHDARMSKAKSRFLERIRNAPDRGTRGKIEWSRGELHER